MRRRLRARYVSAKAVAAGVGAAPPGAAGGCRAGRGAAMMPAVMDALELAILVGIQASGKTTYYRRHMADDHVHVSLDNWRGKDNVRAKERRAILDGLAAAADSDGLVGVAVDNTNTTAATRRRYFDCASAFARRTGRPVRVVAYFFDAELGACLQRNERRPPPESVPAGEPYHVPPPAVVGFHNRLEPPAPEEGFQKIFRVRVAGDEGFEVTEMDGSDDER